MVWHKLNSAEGLNKLISRSHGSPQVLFKHSTRCSISALALSRVQSGTLGIDFYVLDIVTFRELSNQVASHFGVAHESPQLLIIYKGRSAFDISHLGISASIIEKQVSDLVGK